MAYLDWETVKHNAGGKIIRAKVPGGWLVCVGTGIVKSMALNGLTFVPDPNHEWK
jgi:hypothetical protein